MDVKYKRILLKLSGEALSSSEDILDINSLRKTAAQIAELVKLGIEVGIVIGGGNIWRARSAANMERNRADHMGMLATTINSLGLLDALQKAGVDSIVFSAVEMPRFCETFTARAADNALRNKTVSIFAAGSGSPFFTTDTAAALRACEIHADALLLAKNVDALYDKNPDTNPDAVKLPHPTYDEVISRSLGGMDQTAVTLCKEQRVPIVIFPLNGENSISDAVKGINIGTLIDS